MKLTGYCLTTTALLIGLPGLALAEEDELGWSGKGEFGYVASRGNTDTETLKVAAEGVYNLEDWRYTAFINTLKTSENDDDTADRLELGGEADYKLSQQSYWFGSFRYEDDEFSSFESQATVATGYGRKLINTDRHELNGELGLGYRRAEVRSSGETETDPILRGSMDYEWIISDTATFSNETLIESGSDNTFATNATGLETRVNSRLALKVAYELRHNTDVVEPRNNSDFLTTINLIYHFD